MKKSLKTLDTFAGSFIISPEIYKKRMFHNKFLKNRSKVNWENYRKQRNHVNKVKKKSVQNYFFERCVGGPKSSDLFT
jgi:hypothetical protein